MPSERRPRLHSALYVGRVAHTRYSPFLHRFRYRLCMVYLDLAELDVVFRKRWLWSTRRPAWARFRRDDHLGDPERALDDCVRELVEAETGERPQGPIRLLTQLRYLGFVINPVSFYYCFDEADETVETVVAEVHNTPWGERHCYVLPRPVREPSADCLEIDKTFHVSPFLPMELRYRWEVSVPAETLRVKIENHSSRGRVFDAALDLRRRPVTTSNLAGALARFPLTTVKVFAAIYWQALRLWWRGATYHPHPRTGGDVKHPSLSTRS